MSVSYSPLGSALGNPSGAVRSACQDVARVFGVEECWFTSMGSTILNHVVITYARRKHHGKPVIATANPHKSLVDAAADFEVPLRFIPVGFDPTFEATIPPTAQKVADAITKYPNAAALIITSPTYEGLEANVHSIVQEARHARPNLPVFVDNAWGSGLESPLLQGADVALRSSHKMDGAWQGAAVMLVNGERVDRDLLRECVSARLSSSQSYPILCSIEQIYQLWLEYGDEFRSILEEWGEALRHELAQRGVKVLDQQHCAPWIAGNSITSLDALKITVATGFANGYEVSRKLQRSGIIPEKAGPRTITLIVTARLLSTDPIHFADAICDSIEAAGMSLNHPLGVPLPLNQWDHLRSLEMHEAFYRGTSKVPLEEAPGKVAAEVLVPYPPGIPTIIPGQLLLRDVIEYVRWLKDLGGEVMSGDRDLRTVRVVES